MVKIDDPFSSFDAHIDAMGCRAADWQSNQVRLFGDDWAF